MSTLVAASYPVDVLEGCETALVLFAAAFGGAQDAAFIREAGLRATCVDTDGERLEEMLDDYPDDWEFVTADAFQWTENVMVRRRWDVVSLDPFTNLFDRCAERLPIWCMHARRAVILGCAGTTRIRPPDGWRITAKHHRSSFNGGTYWAVIQKIEGRV